MEITIELTLDHWKSFQKYLEKERTSSVKNITDNFWFNLFSWMVLAFVFMFIFRKFNDFHWQSAVFVVGIIILIAIMVIYKSKKIYAAYQPEIGGAFLGTHNLRFDEDGIHSYGKCYESRNGWETVKSIKNEVGLIMLFIDTSVAFIIPKDKVDNSDALFDHICSLYTQITSRPVNND